MSAASHEFMMDQDRELARCPDYLNWLAVTSTQPSKGNPMNIEEAFPSKYIAAADLQGRFISATISHVTMEKMGDDMKPVLWFVGKQKGLTINKTKKSILVDAFGPETTAWSGKGVSLRPVKTTFQGRLVDAIELQPAVQQHAPAQPQPVYQPPAQQAPAQQAEPAFIDDDVPF